MDGRKKLRKIKRTTVDLWSIRKELAMERDVLSQQNNWSCRCTRATLCIYVLQITLNSILLIEAAGKINIAAPRHSNMQLHTFLLLFVILCHLECDARNNINGSNRLVNGETLVSAGENFELGFFSDERELNRSYVGIWYYKLRPRTVVWVANLDKPIPLSSMVQNEDISVVVAEDGNLKVQSSSSYTYFSTQLESATSSNRTVELLDSGNLVLIDEAGVKLWQSFLHPTDTFVPGMKMEVGLKLKDSSRKYTFQLDQTDDKKYVITQAEDIYWRGSVPLGTSEFTFSDMSSSVAYMLSNFTENDIVANSPELTTRRKVKHLNYSSLANNIMKDFVSSNKRLVMNSSGEIQLYGWGDKSGWSLMWAAPKMHAIGMKNVGNLESVTATIFGHCANVCLGLSLLLQIIQEQNFQVVVPGCLPTLAKKTIYNLTHS